MTPPESQNPGTPFQGIDDRTVEGTIAIQMNNPKAWYDRAGSLYQLGRYPEAIASYDKAIEFEPNYPDAWNNRGMALKCVGQYEEAIASFEKAIALKSDYAQAWNNRGNLLTQLQRDREAVESYEKAIEIDENYWQAWHNQGEALAKLERYEAAIGCYDRALKLKPDLRETHRLRRIAIAQWQQQAKVIEKSDNFEKEIEPAIEITAAEIPVEENPKLAACDRLVELYPNDDEAWLDRGNALSELSRYEEAIVSYERAIAIQTDSYLAWKNRAIALKQLGRYEEAVNSYERALELTTPPSSVREIEEIVTPEETVSVPKLQRKPHVKLWRMLGRMWRQVVKLWRWGMRLLGR